MDNFPTLHNYIPLSCKTANQIHRGLCLMCKKCKALQGVWTHCVCFWLLVKHQHMEFLILNNSRIFLAFCGKHLAVFQDSWPVGLVYKLMFKLANPPSAAAFFPSVGSLANTHCTHRNNSKLFLQVKTKQKSRTFQLYHAIKDLIFFLYYVWIFILVQLKRTAFIQISGKGCVWISKNCYVTRCFPPATSAPVQTWWFIKHIKKSHCSGSFPEFFNRYCTNTTKSLFPLYLSFTMHKYPYYSWVFSFSSICILG